MSSIMPSKVLAPAESPSPQQNLRNFAVVLFLACFLAASAIHGAVTTGPGLKGIDFKVFYTASQNLNHGEALYQPWRLLYTYSPLLAISIRPLARLPFQTAFLTWSIFSALLAISSVAVYAYAAGIRLRDTAQLAIMLFVCFRTWQTTMNFALGQSNFLMLLFLCGIYLADIRRKPSVVGILIGIAALFKIWMLGLILYPIIKRQWNVVAIALGLFGVCMVALFGLVGFHEFSDFIKSDRISGKQAITIQVAQSIYGFTSLHFKSNPVVTPLVNNPLAFELLFAALSGMVVWGLISLWKLGPQFTDTQSKLILGICTVSLLLLLPPCENEYLVLCMPLLWNLIAAPRSEDSNVSMWTILGGLLVYLDFSRPTPYAPIPLAYHHGLASLVISLPLYGEIILWLIAIQTLRKSYALAESPITQESLIASPAREVSAVHRSQVGIEAI